jgi:hypothetical protein
MTREQKNYGIVIGKSQSKSMISVTEKEQAENYKAEEW